MGGGRNSKYNQSQKALEDSLRRQQELLQQQLLTRKMQLPADRNKTSAVRILMASNWDFDKEDRTEAMRILLEAGWTYEEITGVLDPPPL
jgi:hypothetical protein